MNKTIVVSPDTHERLARISGSYALIKERLPMSTILCKMHGLVDWDRVEWEGVMEPNIYINWEGGKGVRVTNTMHSKITRPDQRQNEVVRLLIKRLCEEAGVDWNDPEGQIEAGMWLARRN